MASTAHRWKFIRAGGIDQVIIRSGADVANLEQLDQKLWVALACPTRGVWFDPRTLDLIDTDGDGRIRPPELVAVSRWVREHFADPDRLMQGGDRVPLDAIKADTEAGRRLIEEARALLQVVGRPDADAISLADLSERIEVLSRLGFNGDGVVPETGAGDPATAALIKQVIDTVGGVADRNGRLGVDAAHAAAFFAEAEALQQWRSRGAADPALTPLGEASRAAGEALAAVRAKVDDYYVRCRLAAYDVAAAAPLHPSLDEYRALGETLLDPHAAGLASLPLATPARERPLPLREGLNAAWAERIEALRVHAAEPLLGRALEVLGEAEWQALKECLSACGDWLAARPPTRLDALAPAALQALLEPATRARLDALIVRDAEAGPANPRILDLERLVRFQRDLVHLLNNFVSFSEFYSRQGAIFEAGVLYLDARSCQLTVEVADVAKHATLAGLAKAYLAYCECSRLGQKKTIVAAFTAGDVDFLFAGRNGVFYDRNGDDWDATITKVIENPMSIRQAFFAPYKKFVRMIEEQVAKHAAASDQRSLSMLGNLATRTTTVDQPARPGSTLEALRIGQQRIDVGTVAALGVALGSISAVLVAVFTKFIELGWWIPVGILGIVMAISGPSMLIAWLKLRQRSLGPILDASGWAINGRMRVNVPLGGSLTLRARLPAGSERRLRDPYAEGRTGWTLAWLGLLVVAAVAAAWRLGWLQILAAPG